MKILDFDSVMGGQGDWFEAKLFRLIAKADQGNRERLRKGFPDEVREVERRLRKVPKTLVEIFSQG